MSENNRKDLNKNLIGQLVLDIFFGVGTIGMITGIEEIRHKSGVECFYKVEWVDGHYGEYDQTEIDELIQLLKREAG